MHHCFVYARHSQQLNVSRSKILLEALTLCPMDTAIAMVFIQPSCAVDRPNQTQSLREECFPIMRRLLTQLSSIGVPNEEQNRRQLRELLFTAPGIEDHISGVVSGTSIVQANNLKRSPDYCTLFHIKASGTPAMLV